MAATLTTALDQFKVAFPGQVTTPDAGPRYESSVTDSWSQTCWTPAAAFVHLRSTQEVAEALAIVKKTGCRFAIRSTGHNPNVGFSSADETGIVLDIRQLQSKELGIDGVARLGAGHTWGEVFAWLEGQELSVVGGRDLNVGIAGFLLGGGMCAFPNLRGIGADGVKGFEIVLADGSVVQADAETNFDLYRALKGGGPNFGIVTRLNLDTHPLAKVQYIINLYDVQDYAGIINASIQLQEAAESDPKIGFFANFNQGFVAVGLMYADWPTELPQVFGHFLGLKSLMSTAVPTTNGTPLSLAQAIGNSREAKKRTVGNVTTKISEDLYVGVHKLWVEACKGLPANAAMHYTIQPVGSATALAGEERGGNTMGLAKVPQCWWVFTCEWPKDGSDESDDIAAQKAVDFMVQNVGALARKTGLLLDNLCMNFAGGSQKVLRSYGVDNFKKLQEAAAKYDPDGMFQNLQIDGFLLRNNL